VPGRPASYAGGCRGPDEEALATAPTQMGHLTAARSFPPHRSQAGARSLTDETTEFRPKQGLAEHYRGHSHSPERGRDVTDPIGENVSCVLGQARREASRGSSRLLRDVRQAHCAGLARAP